MNHKKKKITAKPTKNIEMYSTLNSLERRVVLMRSTVKGGVGVSFAYMAAL